MNAEESLSLELWLYVRTCWYKECYSFPVNQMNWHYIYIFYANFYMFINIFFRFFPFRASSVNSEHRQSIQSKRHVSHVHVILRSIEHDSFVSGQKPHWIANHNKCEYKNYGHLILVSKKRKKTHKFSKAISSRASIIHLENAVWHQRWMCDCNQCIKSQWKQDWYI